MFEKPTVKSAAENFTTSVMIASDLGITEETDSHSITKFNVF